MERVCAIAARHGLKVVEDCAQASGASWAGRPVGSWGDVGCFSFFPTKNLGGAGDGGAVTCRDQELAQRMRELAVHGMPRRYLHTELGYNSRLDAIQAAVLNVKLPHLERWVERRSAIAATYRQGLAAAQTIALPEAGPEGHSWNQFVVRVPSCSPRRPAAATAPPQPTAPASGCRKPAAATGSSSNCRTPASPRSSTTRSRSTASRPMPSSAMAPARCPSPNGCAQRCSACRSSRNSAMRSSNG